MTLRPLCTLAVAVTFSLAAISAMAQSAAGPDRAPAQAPAAMRAEITQAAALGTLSAVNTGEINAGRLALAQASDAATKRYAQRMIDEHTRNNEQVATWTADAGAPPARAKMEEGKRTLAMLQPMKAPAFDKAYLQAMVRDHQGALQALDSTLIPAATEAPVATFLRTTLGHVADHLKAAQDLLAQMGGTGTEPNAAR